MMKSRDFQEIVIEHDLLDVEKFLEAKEMITIATTRFYLEKIGKPSPKFDFTSQIQRVKELLEKQSVDVDETFKCSEFKLGIFDFKKFELEINAKFDEEINELQTRDYSIDELSDLKRKFEIACLDCN